MASLAALQTRIERDFPIGHVTIQIEPEGARAADTPRASTAELDHSPKAAVEKFRMNGPRITMTVEAITRNLCRRGVIAPASPRSSRPAGSA